MTMRIAHLSDVHVLDLEGIKPWRYLNKRLTGLANLKLSRKDAHPSALLERLVEGLVADPVDHVVVTGDLSNLSLETEFERARQILEPLGGYERLSVIPGNHDIYTRGSARAKLFERFFGHLMWREGAERLYPWYKDLGPVGIYGFNSAYPTAPFIATGRVGDTQLQRLAALASGTDDPARPTLALVHHNLHRRRWRKDKMHGLKDRDALIEACARAGVDVILHGHTHVAHRFTSKGVEIVGCGSSTWSSTDPEHTARYNVYTFDAGALADTEVRIYDFESEKFRPIKGGAG